MASMIKHCSSSLACQLAWGTPRRFLKHISRCPECRQHQGVRVKEIRRTKPIRGLRFSVSCSVHLPWGEQLGPVMCVRITKGPHGASCEDWKLWNSEPRHFSCNSFSVFTFHLTLAAELQTLFWPFYIHPHLIPTITSEADAFTIPILQVRNSQLETVKAVYGHIAMAQIGSSNQSVLIINGLHHVLKNFKSWVSKRVNKNKSWKKITRKTLNLKKCKMTTKMSSNVSTSKSIQSMAS